MKGGGGKEKNIPRTKRSQRKRGSQSNKKAKSLLSASKKENLRDTLQHDY
jgi:hypothetical protein